MPMESPGAGFVGVFDSGLGGLSVLRAMAAALPQVPLVYLADSGHAPYGGRTPEYIQARADLLTRSLLDAGAGAIVVACNTATVVAVQQLRRWCPVPIVAMEPAIKPAAAHTRSGVVGVLATETTVQSPAVQRLCAQWAQGVQVLLQPCPGWVERVECGDIHSAATRAAVAERVQPLLQAGADTLVLGCTHYPFLAPLIQEIAGPQVTLIDPAPAVARELARRLAATRKALGPPAPVRYYATGDVAQVQAALRALMAEPNAQVQPLQALMGLPRS